NKILIVDDDPEIISLIKDLLDKKDSQLEKSSKALFNKETIERDTFQVYTAETPKEGLKIFKDNLKERLEFGLAVLDIQMQGRQEGIDLALAIRKLNPNLEIIFMTSHNYSLESTAEKVGEGVQYLKKPFDSNQFIQMVKKGLYEYNRSISLQSLAYFNLESTAGAKISTLGAFFEVYLRDFRNLQNGILSSMELIKEGNCSKEEVEVISEMAKGSLDKMHNYIEDFGIFFNKFNLRSTDFSLNELLLVIQGELRSKCLKENIKFNLEVVEGISANGDVYLIKKSLTHLLNNSIKALKGSGEDALITVRVLEEGRKIEIDDNGPGISEKDLSYSRLWMLNIKNFPKSGLGFPFVDKVMKAHGGDMSIITGKGRTIVRLNFPKVTSEKKPS
ncbi:MAG: hybrid sensor histidine kinase/response regulator, partial [Bdellovibrionota bacterium]|nr:hybrid sensor histidine kinase/response regulator [Bdellovibrionota bacterium]